MNKLTKNYINAQRKYYAENYPYGWKVLQEINTDSRPTYNIDSDNNIWYDISVWVDRKGFLNIFNDETKERIVYESIVEFMEYVENKWGNNGTGI